MEEYSISSVILFKLEEYLVLWMPAVRDFERGMCCHTLWRKLPPGSIYFFVSPFVGMIQYNSTPNFAFPFWLVPTLLISRSWTPYNKLIFVLLFRNCLKLKKKEKKIYKIWTFVVRSGLVFQFSLLFFCCFNFFLSGLVFCCF